MQRLIVTIHDNDVEDLDCEEFAKEISDKFIGGAHVTVTRIPNYRFTCSKCGSVAEITEDEVKRLGKWDNWYFEFKCPVCDEAYRASVPLNVFLCMKEFKKLR